MQLIIPAAGRSTRFPDMRPKWLLTHPSGNIMLMEAMRGLNLDDFEHIYLTILSEHAESYQCIRGIQEQFEALNVANKLTIVQLENDTQHQPQTVAYTIEKHNLKGPIFCKDTDNYFKAQVTPDNAICISNLENIQLINASNKSYVQINENGFVTNIVEKKVISSHFSVGGYGFASAEQYLKYYETIKDRPNLYLSDIIFCMILDEHSFIANEVQDFLDWGTLDDWNRYKQSFAVLLIDIDGVLVKNSSQVMPPYWGQTEGIARNIDVIRRLYDANRAQIILTTARTEAAREVTLQQLKKENIPYHQIVFGLYHAKRIVINDYCNTNPYKSCDAVNILRDSDRLEEMLCNLIK